ncbi:nitrous oxide reductase family maturation protein NosD [Streptomyces sp. TP-A0356]|uniref:right-handed parallel beta-helix repeat-containing protein n=1 Tax=Streptomyces sp. TP-A0356 TaxID=1359208 RepID=UPI0006E3F4ED|nr:right-handed parallel beta-helix repeat-containing protein [Streptomyces sp. TP-A0356]
MKKHHIVYVACTAALAGCGLGVGTAAAGPTTHLVRPGGSIQKAVDSAKPGDTVLLSAGTYRESIRVTTSGVTLRGMGRNTVISPGKASSKNACAKAGNGICVEGRDGHPVQDITVTSLTLSGFPKNGLWSSRTNGLTVRQVTAEKNGQWGIAQERSTRGLFLDNTIRGNGDTGLLLANVVGSEGGATDTEGAMIARNLLEGNRVGVTVRRLRDLTVTRNDITANCAAVFVVGDENNPKAGALTVSDNHITKNNKFCPKTARVPFLKGSGIVLTGAEDTVLTRNVITDNAGNSPLSGGIVLFKSMTGGPNQRHQINGNTLQRNAPADLVNADTGKDNVFQRNACRASKPSGLC